MRQQKCQLISPPVRPDAGHRVTHFEKEQIDALLQAALALRDGFDGFAWCDLCTHLASFRQAVAVHAQLEARSESNLQL
jgi:hypothetical protein